MLPAVTTSLPTYWLYIMTLSSMAGFFPPPFFFKGKRIWCNVACSNNLKNLAKSLLTCRLQLHLPRKSRFIIWGGGISQTRNYKCDELKWQKYLVGGESGGLHLMLRDSCQDVSCCRLFCFYHMRCVFSRCVESQHCLRSAEPFLAYAAACVHLKIKHLLFKAPRSIFCRAPGQRVYVQSLQWGTVEICSRVVVAFYFGLKN